MESDNLKQVVVDLLKQKSFTISTAESCTAGLLSKYITDVPGSSEVFTCGVTAYSNEIKSTILGVKPDTIRKYGAVSAETAVAMAAGVRKISGTSLGIGITGIAGPGGGSAEKPVGLVYIALADSSRVWVNKMLADKGMDREYIRISAACNALDLVKRYLESLPDILPGSIKLSELNNGKGQ